MHVVSQGLVKGSRTSRRNSLTTRNTNQNTKLEIVFFHVHAIAQQANLVSQRPPLIFDGHLDGHVERAPLAKQAADLERTRAAVASGSVVLAR